MGLTPVVPTAPLQSAPPFWLRQGWSLNIAEPAEPACDTGDAGDVLCFPYDSPTYRGQRPAQIVGLGAGGSSRTGAGVLIGLSTPVVPNVVGRGAPQGHG